MKEPVDHILRPRLPWRTDVAALTECGYDATKVKALTRDDIDQRLKDLGKQRTAMLTCMTCMNTAGRWKTWDEDPREAIGREVEWEGRWRQDRGHRLRDELLAIEALIAAHPEEFKKLLADIDARREWRDRKAREEQKPKPRTVVW
jgi:hypothetical protein